MSSMYFMCALPRYIERRSPKSTACQGRILLGDVCVPDERIYLCDHSSNSGELDFTSYRNALILSPYPSALRSGFSRCGLLLLLLQLLPHPGLRPRISGVRASPKSSASKI